MDPNANLSEQALLVPCIANLSAAGKRRLLELREALQAWLVNGGFAPDWNAYPNAALKFGAWQARLARRNFRHIG